MRNNNKVKIYDLPKNIFSPKGFVDCPAFLKHVETENGIILDFTGFESATDLIFWYLKSNLSISQSFKLDCKKFLLNGCPYLSIWTIHYLNAIWGRSIFDIEPEIKVIFTKKKYSSFNFIL